MMSDEKKAQKAWKEYSEAINEYQLHLLEDLWHTKGDPLGYMYDAFFAGYYAGRDDFKKMDTDILDALNDIRLNQTGWECNEDIMTFNREPIGATIRKNIEIDRWWGDLKRHIANYLFDKFYKEEE